MLQQVYAITRDPRLEGRVAFIEDYEMHLAHRLVQGVDLWLNVPRVPLEACGTSGMKAALNAVPQLSTLDGWWHEGYHGQQRLGHSTGGLSRTDGRAVRLGRCRAVCTTLLEKQVVPMYYQRDARGLPVEWLQRMKHALRVAGERFDARRMVAELRRRSTTRPRCAASSPATDPPH